MSKEKKAPSIWIPLVLVIAVSSGIQFYTVSSMKSSIQEPVTTVKGTAPVELHYLTVEPFTVNILSESHRSRLLYSGISISTDDEASLNILQSHLPQLKNRLISILSSSHSEELVTPEGKEKLAKRILDSLRDDGIINQYGLKINEVLFTDFVVQ